MTVMLLEQIFNDKLTNNLMGDNPMMTEYLGFIKAQNKCGIAETKRRVVNLTN